MTFEELYKINVNEKTEKKNGLTYLSWAWAWAEFKKAYPDATYVIKTFDGMPYICDEITGYMVFTEVTAGGLTYPMWLPVMDSSNKAMKMIDYTYKDRYGKEHRVERASMFDINKTIMRCLVKNLAMFGLGLYIYAGEDLPEDLTTEETVEDKLSEVMKKTIEKTAKEHNVPIDKILERYKVSKLEDIKASDFAKLMDGLKKS